MINLAKQIIIEWSNAILLKVPIFKNKTKLKIKTVQLFWFGNVD